MTPVFRASIWTTPSRQGCSADSSDQGSRPQLQFGSGLGVNRCNCPLDQDEKQLQLVGNLTKIVQNHTVKFGADVRRAWNLRVPSDVHRSGELSFSNDRNARPVGRRPRPRHVPARRRHALRPLRQPVHRRGRAAMAALLLRAGHLAGQFEADAELRTAARRHQPADRQRRRQGRVPAHVGQRWGDRYPIARHSSWRASEGSR